MEKFFSTVASLMSLLIRSLIEATLNDLIEFVSKYTKGNHYSGVYDYFDGLALPIKQLAFVFYFLSQDRQQPQQVQPTQQIQQTQQQPQQQQIEIIHMSPSLDHTLDQFNYAIDLIVNCLNDTEDFPRLECLLFQGFNRSTSNLRYFNVVTINEQSIVAYKEKIKQVLKVNSSGPKLFVFKYTFLSQHLSVN